MEPGSSDITWEERKALIIGRAYPEPSKRHIETVCTAAITEEGQLLRLYPVSWRYLDENKRYRLWTWAKFDVRKGRDDKRKESYHVREETIFILSYVESWAERFSLLKKAVFPDRETLERLYREDWTSLGLIEIEYVDFKVSPRKSSWEKDKPYIKQSHLYVEVKPLEQIPVQMKLRFRCKGNAGCRTHQSTLIGWEYMEAFRKFRRSQRSESEAVAMIKDHMVRLFSDPMKSCFALVGMHFRYPVWMIGQLYFFDKNLPLRLF
jgi:hypothetical protein